MALPGSAAGGCGRCWPLVVSRLGLLTSFSLVAGSASRFGPEQDPVCPMTFDKQRFFRAYDFSGPYLGLHHFGITCRDSCPRTFCVGLVDCIFDLC